MGDPTQLLKLTSMGVADPLVVIWERFVYFVPGMLAAIIILFVGYYIAKFIGYIIRVVLAKTSLDKWMKKQGYMNSFGHIEVTSLISRLVRWYVFILFLIEAVSMLQLGRISTLLEGLASWLPQVIIGGLIILFGFFIADLFGTKIEHAKGKWVKPVSLVVKIITLFLFFDVALREVGLRVSLVEQFFLVIVGGFVLFFSLALGISTGMAMKEDAKSWVKKWKKHL